MKSLLESPAHLEVIARIDSLTADSKGLWGKMTLGQMLRHCQFPLEVALGNTEHLVMPGPFMKFLMKGFKKRMYDDRPWKENMPTAKGFKVTEDRDFIPEKARLIQLVDDFYRERVKETWDPHPVFGKFTRLQWGQMQYKHLDHHLRQFGV